MTQSVTKLFDTLNISKVIMPRRFDHHFGLLTQIFNNLYPDMKEDQLKEHERYEKELREQLHNYKKSKKRSCFILKSNEWERKLRVFYNQKVRDEEFGAGGSQGL